MAYKNKEDARRWYQEHKEIEKKKSVQRNILYRKRNKEYVNTVKSAPCTDCKNQYHPFVMDFDHTGDNKEHIISKMVATPFSLDKIKAEIAKCELVCSNCHRMRTLKRSMSVD